MPSSARGGKAAIGSRGHARFLDLPEGEIVIDEEKVAEAARRDGLRPARGCNDADPRELVARYRGPWQIEACFRIDKHDLRIRPIFHWAERRIRARVAICYMAFCCLRHLRRRLAMIGHPTSADETRRELGAVGMWIMTRPGTGDGHAWPAPPTERVRQICRSLGLTWNGAPFRIASARNTRTERD